MYLVILVLTLDCFVLGLSGEVCSNDYDIKVKTGSSLGAGTDAHVYIRLVGTRGVTAVHELTGPSSTFEKNSVDSFIIKDGASIGDLTAVNIKRDESGWFPKWQLTKIGVLSRVTGQWSLFVYDDWTTPNAWITIPITCYPGFTKNSTTGLCDDPKCGAKASDVLTRLLGGSEAPVGSWPWQAIIEFKRDHKRFCSGSLVFPQWVLTTAFCVYGKKPSMLAVRPGAAHAAYSGSSAEQNIEAQDIFIHPDYHKYTIFSHDLALVKLSHPASISNTVNLACLPGSISQVPVSAPAQSCWYTGWGVKSGTLYQAPVPLVSEDKCKSPVQKMHPSMLCGYEARNDTGPCVKDRGGPLSCESQGKWYLKGLVSTGTDCYSNMPKNLIFTKISFLMGWIKQVINNDHDF
ncbi:CUB and peptidase domain-containing protein 2 isoform X2 [Nematostella vectensis]|uniref:CUB and peptidase domain-containing protein 2 isoform X2 n=1 Tax=Nematostella vectensis TaxID=45351 RepID=UPI00207744E5|nr:CUB and peptidase domain-containing protein 2 isoform X2 [Nematostella vectensis]